MMFLVLALRRAASAVRGRTVFVPNVGTRCRGMMLLALRRGAATVRGRPVFVPTWAQEAAA